MANKKINELTELTSLAKDDLLMLYDTSEVGSEKTKKASLESYSTSTDGWVLVDEGTFSNEAISGIYLVPEAGVKYKYVVDGVFDANSYLQINVGGITSGWVNVVGFSNVAWCGSPTANDRCYAEIIVPPVDTGKQKIVTGTVYRVDAGLQTVNNYNASTVEVTYLNLIGYNGGSQNFTGKIKTFAQAW